LAAFVESRRFVPFEWGTNDCCLFAADCVRDLTGLDHAAGIRGTYHDERSARRVVRRMGGMAALAKPLSEKPASHVQRADVVLCDVEGRETFGICIGNGFWCAPGASGLVFRRTCDVLKVFEF
jgi:hypothetical protein